MLVYVGMLIWVFLIGWLQPDQNNPLKSNKAEEYRAKWGMAIALMLPVTFFAMLRTAPIDTQTYIRLFEEAPWDMSQFDAWIATKTDSQLFYGVQALFKCYISDDPTMWLSFIALIEGALLTVTLKKYSPNIAMSVYIFMASTMFTWMYNGVRQFMAVVILFALSHCIVKNRWYIYIPVILLVGGLAPFLEIIGREDMELAWYLGGIHQTAWLMLPVFFFAQGKAWNWKVLLFIAVFVLLIMSGGLDSFIESAAETSVYEGDLEYLAEDDGAHPIRAVVPMVPMILALYKRKQIDAMEDVPPIIPICINMSVVTVALYIASVLTSGLYVGRLPVYTEVYNLILLPWLLAHPYKKSQNILAIGLYGAYLMWFVYQMYIAWGGLSYASATLGLALYGGTW